MKNFALTFAAATSAMTMLSAANAAAQTCSAAPTCASLKYTEAASSCRGKYIVCPFDATKVICLNDGPHVGDLKYSLYSSNHDGWLLCNGTQYSQTAYPKLYNVIHTYFCHKYTSRTDTSYSTSNCKSGYFAVPDYRGFFLRAASTYNSPSNTVGATSSYYSDALNYKGGSYNSSVYYPQYEQLPNITGTTSDGLRTTNGGTQSISGAFYWGGTQSKWANATASGGNSYGLSFQASRSNTIYSGTHVIPANYGAYVFIYAGE